MKDIKLKTETMFDELIGGGLHKGSILLTGSRGVGKTTLAMQVAQSAIDNEYPALFASSEESADALKNAQTRTRTDSVSVLGAEEWSCDLDDLEKIIKRTKPRLLIVDSIQCTIANDDYQEGSTAQIQTVASELSHWAIKYSMLVIMIGQTTNDGNVRGGPSVEHYSDVLMSLERLDVLNDKQFRILSVGNKNRFGKTSQSMLLQFEATGLVRL